jgi:hypothetical protein
VTTDLHGRRQGLGTKKSIIGALLTLTIIASLVAGAWVTQRAVTGNTASASRKILYYIDPMHPAYTSD